MSDVAAGPKREASDVYDRQIRLWGAEAQAKISNAKVLYLHLTGVSSEVLKNLTLAGIRPVLCDGRPYPEAVMDTPSFFLKERHNKDDATKKKIKYASVAHAMKASVEELNPLLGECQVYDSPVQDLSDDFFAQFHTVVASRLDMAQAARIARATTAAGGHFFLVDCFGLSGAAVVDLGPDHTYRSEVGKSLSNVQTLPTYLPVEQIWKVPLGDVVSRVDKTPPLVWIQYRSILEYRARTNKWPCRKGADDFGAVVQSWMAQDAVHLCDDACCSKEALTQLARVATAEVSPVCAVLGGIVGNEVIKAISGKGEPANNAILLDGSAGGKCRNVVVQPKN